MSSYEPLCMYDCTYMKFMYCICISYTRLHKKDHRPREEKGMKNELAFTKLHIFASSCVCLL